MSYNEFRKKVLKADTKKNTFKVNNSAGIRQAYRYAITNKLIDKNISEKDYSTIIKRVNDYYQELLIEGKDALFPLKMGRLEIRKGESKVFYNNDKLIIKYPVDWNRTLKLWYEDKEAYDNKTVVRMEGKDRFKIYYNKEYANYKNKFYYQFIPTRTFKQRLKNKIINEGLDASLLKENNELYKYKTNYG